MTVQKITLLAIESSCDDTAASVLKDGKILSNMVAGQAVHEQYGGVVPELASRSHQRNIIPVVDVALKKAQTQLSDLDVIAFTQGPGLMGSLLVGHNFAKGLSLALNKPMIGINHLDAHVLACLIDTEQPVFPYLCLLVSGGHTQIVKVNSATEMQVLGKTIDDAAGEAFDKAAKIMGLPYPGGPLVDKYAQTGNPNAFKFNAGKVPNLDFSFSGFKTSVLYFLRDQQLVNATFINDNLSDICASVQSTIVNYLLSKLKLAVEQTGIKTVTIAGGVAANSGLRIGLKNMAEKYGWKYSIPAFEYCTDNAAMIAWAAWHQFREGAKTGLDSKVFAAAH